MISNEAPIVVGLGELLWDLFADSRRPGGAPANVAFQAGQLGCRGVVCSRVGCDALGDELLAFLAAQGLTTQWVQRDLVRPTGTVTVDASRPAHPQFTIHENTAWDNLEFTPACKELIGRAAAVCFGTLAQRSPQSREAIHRCLREAAADCVIVYDVNLRQQWYDRCWVERSLRASRVVKLNAEEVTMLDGLLDLGTRQPMAFGRALQEEYGVETVCITRAEHGALLVGRDEAVDHPGVRVQVADAVGAGDAFTAALIVARLRGWPLATQAALANSVGALVAGRPGAMPILRDEFARLLAAY